MPNLAKRVWKAVEEVGYLPNYPGARAGLRAQPHARPDRLGDHQSVFP